MLPPPMNHALYHGLNGENIASYVVGQPINIQAYSSIAQVKVHYTAKDFSRKTNRGGGQIRIS